MSNLKYVVKQEDIASREGVSKIIEYSAFELKYIGRAIEWVPNQKEDAPAPASAAPPYAAVLSDDESLYRGRGPRGGSAC